MQEGKTALDWATAKGHDETVEVLRAAGGMEREVEMFIVECTAFAEDLLSEIREKIKAVGDEEDYDDEGAASPSSMQDIRAKGRTFSVVAGLAGTGTEGPSRVEGWMAKKGHLFRSWRNRWFVLDDGDMSYFSKAEDRKSKGTVKLTPDTQVESLTGYHRPFVFKVTTPSKAFMLQAADEDELDEWLSAVQAHIDALT
jgi:ankyrin repeat protein